MGKGKEDKGSLQKEENEAEREKEKEGKEKRLHEKKEGDEVEEKQKEKLDKKKKKKMERINKTLLSPSAFRLPLFPLSPSLSLSSHDETNFSSSPHQPSFFPSFPLFPPWTL